MKSMGFFLILSYFLSIQSVPDYMQWERDWELIEGILYAMAPSPVKKHQKLMGIIFAYFFERLEDWKIDEKNVLRSDVSIVCNDHNPDFIANIFEIVSPSTTLKDENIKFNLPTRGCVILYSCLS